MMPKIRILSKTRDSGEAMREFDLRIPVANWLLSRGPTTSPPALPPHP